MKPFIILILPIVFVILSFLVISKGNGEKLMPTGKEDSLVHNTDNYIQYINGMAAHGRQYMSTYIKISGHKKYMSQMDLGYWPDSIEETISVVRYNKEPVEYSETPLLVPVGTNLEYDNYYYKGKLLAYRVFEVINNSECAGGTLTNTMTAYYDSTGRNIKTSRSLSGPNNIPIDTSRCPALDDFSHLYKSYPETPLAKEGIEPKKK